MTASALHILCETYENRPLTFFEYSNVPCVAAIDVGRVLGYARDGSRFSEMCISEWADELPEGTHRRLIEGEDLEWLKARLPTGSVGSRARHILLLTDRGLLRAAMLAGGPVAVRFRDWAEGVLLREMKGQTAPALVADSGPSMKERRLRIAEITAARLLATEERLRIAEARIAAVNIQARDGHNEAEVRALWSTVASLLLGREVKLKARSQMPLPFETH